MFISAWTTKSTARKRSSRNAVYCGHTLDTLIFRATDADGVRRWMHIEMDEDGRMIDRMIADLEKIKKGLG